MAIAVALLVSDHPATTEQVSHALQDLSILPDVCHQMAESIRLLNCRKFDAVVVDLQLGRQSGDVLNEGTSIAVESNGSDVCHQQQRRRNYVILAQEIKFYLRKIPVCAQPQRHPQISLRIDIEGTTALFPSSDCSSSNRPEARHAGSSLL
jgi:CheY-like chemotaxis protein